MKKLKILYYSLLTIALFLVFITFSIDSWKMIGMITIPLLYYLIFPLIIAILILIIVLCIKKYKLKIGLKESAPQVYLFLILLFLSYGIYKLDNYVNNKINVEFVNKTDKTIQNIELVGRNAQTIVETLKPKESVTKIFRGKAMVMMTDNDYDNEVKILYFYNNKLSEVPILKGFNRWMVIDDDWKIELMDSDSVKVDIHQ